MSEHVQTCLNLFRLNMIGIVMILKHVKTRNENMMKYTKIEQMVHEMLLTEDKAIPWIASSKSSDQKDSKSEL